MNACTAIDITRAWVHAQAPHIPGFCAAHLVVGSLRRMPPEAEVPATGDVDFNMIVAQDQPTETFNIPWQGLVLEYSMFPFKFQPHARPYVIDGPAEMIAEGCHREAMLWIEGWIVFSNVVIQADAPEAERPAFRQRLDALRAAKGYGPESLAQRREQARRLAEDVYRLCER